MGHILFFSGCKIPWGSVHGSHYGSDFPVCKCTKNSKHLTKGVSQLLSATFLTNEVRNTHPCELTISPGAVSMIEIARCMYVTIR